MKLAQPIERVRDQKVPDFVAAVIEDVSAPIRVFAFARIEMLVQRRAVETSQRECVFREMGRHPIHDYADAAFVKMIDEETKFVRRAVTRGGCEVRTDLIAPRRSIGMFFQGKKFNMSETLL